MSCHSAVDGLHSVREVKSALSQHSATKRCKCTSWMTLLLRDVDLDQFDHMAAEPTHGPHHSCSSSSWLGASDPFLAIGNLFPYGGSTYISQVVYLTLDHTPARAYLAPDTLYLGGLGHGSRNWRCSPTPCPNWSVEIFSGSEFNSASTTTLVESNLVDMAAFLV